MSQVNSKITIDQVIPKEKKVKRKYNLRLGVRHPKMGKFANVGQ